jgi:auxin efflux carrier family
MIGWGDLYKVVSGMAPLYFALVLGYSSVRWWKLFTRDQCDAINRLVIYFALPFFAFDFNAHAGTFAASYRVLAADAIAKLLVVLSLAVWAAAVSRKAAPASYSWCITGFSLATLSNGLLVGAPLMDAMYGKWARDIVVQLSVVQAVVWLPVLLVVFEARQAWMEVRTAPAPALEEGLQQDNVDPEAAAAAAGGGRKKTGYAFWAPLLRNVGLKVVGNPNVYASLLGVLWSTVANR